MKQMIKLGLILAAYTAAACFMLALVNNATAPAIAAVKQKQLNEGLRLVYADADNFAPAEGFSGKTVNGVSIDGIYAALKNDAVIGAVVQATGATYDSSTLLVGVSGERAITAVHFLACSDTPGFGQKATLPSFTGQFAEKSIDSAFEPGKDLEAISGATITTNGVAKILKTAAAEADMFLSQK